MVARFLTTLARDDEVSVVMDLLPKVLPNMKSSASVVAALQCLGRHSERDAALLAFSVLKSKGMLVHTVTFPSIRLVILHSEFDSSTCSSIIVSQHFLNMGFCDRHD